MQELLKKVSLFSGLKPEDLQHLESIMTTIHIKGGELAIEQNTTGNEIYIIAKGSVEVFVKGMANERTLVLLGEEQIFGEMAIIDQGYRSASVRATKGGCTLYVVSKNAFDELCQTNHYIGYQVMRNLAIDLAFKVRHRNLAEM